MGIKWRTGKLRGRVRGMEGPARGGRPRILGRARNSQDLGSRSDSLTCQFQKGRLETLDLNCSPLLQNVSVTENLTSAHCSEDMTPCGRRVTCNISWYFWMLGASRKHKCKPNAHFYFDKLSQILNFTNVEIFTDEEKQHFWKKKNQWRAWKARSMTASHPVLFRG